MFTARFLQPTSAITPKSKMFTRRLAERRAESIADDKATLPAMVVSPDLFATMVPGVANLVTADTEPVTAAQGETALVPVAKVKESGKKRKNESSVSTSRKRSF